MGYVDLAPVRDNPRYFIDKWIDEVARDCVLYLPLYKLPGNSFLSRDNYGHLCTVTGAVWTPQGRKLDGIDDFIDVPVASSLITPTEGTIFAWIKGYGTGDDDILTFSDKDTTGQNSLRVMTNATPFVQIRVQKAGGISYEIRTPNGSINSTDWFCVAWASNGSAIEIDINGRPQSLTVSGGTNNGDWVGDLSNIDTLNIGRLNEPTPANYYAGDMRLIALYSTYKRLPARQRVYLATKNVMF